MIIAPDQISPEWISKLWCVVVAIDPSITTGDESDEVGIVVAGLDFRRRCFVLDDLSGRLSPDEWGQVVKKAVVKYKANRVVVETNQGGDLVVGVLLSQALGVPIEKIRATKGKLTRAEPVAALYEQGRVFHVKNFPELEQQMVEWTADTRKSPDRMDALVYAITSLMLTPAAYTTRWIPDNLTAV